MVVVAEVTCFGCTTRSRVLRVEINNRFLAAQILVCHLFAGLVHNCELRHLVAYIKHSLNL